MIFKETIKSDEELRTLLGTPSKNVSNKTIDHLDRHCLDFISKSPIIFVSTADENGHCDTSPRGDSPGFVHVIDHQHLVIPERPGNKRMDSLRNIIANPHIGLIFVIPGLEETLRINGKACVMKDIEILNKMAVNGKTPLLGIGVEVEECYMHCAKAFKRSKLWHSETWLPKDALPSPSEILADHINLPEITKETVYASLQESYTKRLY